LRVHLTYGEERLQGLHADLEKQLRAQKQESIDQGYSSRRQTVDSLLLVVYILLEIFLGKSGRFACLQHAFYREILGVRVMVNWMGLLKFLPEASQTQNNHVRLVFINQGSG